MKECTTYTVLVSETPGVRNGDKTTNSHGKGLLGGKPRSQIRWN